MKPQHTPTPWKLNGSSIEGKDKKGMTVWVGNWDSDGVNDNDEDNAQFIVRAVNSHEALLKAAKRIRDSINAEQEQDGLKDYTEGFVAAFDKLEKAIAQAEGGK